MRIGVILMRNKRTQINRLKNKKEMEKRFGSKFLAFSISD